jgi:hypothetical protein
LIYECWRADPVDGITGEEDQKRNEECGADEDESYSCGRPGRDQLTAVVLSVADIERIKEAAYRAGREDASNAVWARSQELRRTFRTGEVGIEYINGVEDASEIALEGQARSAADEPDDNAEQAHAAAAEVIWGQAFEAGKRAGREDAARDILDVLRQREDAAHETYARRRALGVGDQAAEWAVRSRAWRQARQAAEEAAIAVGDGVQPTEEQRARE